MFGRLKGAWHEIFDFFHKPVYPWHLSILLGQMRIFKKIRGDIRILVLITSIIATCAAIIYRRTPAMKHLQQNKLAYTSKWTLCKKSY